MDPKRQKAALEGTWEEQSSRIAAWRDVQQIALGFWPSVGAHSPPCRLPNHRPPLQPVGPLFHRPGPSSTGRAPSATSRAPLQSTRPLLPPAGPLFHRPGALCNRHTKAPSQSGERLFRRNGSAEQVPLSHFLPSGGTQHGFSADGAPLLRRGSFIPDPPGRSARFSAQSP